MTRTAFPLKLAVVTESPLDDAVAAAIDGAVRGEAPLVGPLAARPPGVDALIRRLPGVVKQVHLHTDADALIVLADADLTEPHDPERHRTASVPGCRWCILHTLAQQSLAALPEAPRRAPLHIGIGVAVPALEAWLLAGRGVVRSEREWAAARRENRFQGVRRQLKAQAYGGPAVATAEAQRLAIPLITAGVVDGRLRSEFPGGYAPLEDAIRSW